MQIKTMNLNILSFSESGLQLLTVKQSICWLAEPRSQIPIKWARFELEKQNKFELAYIYQINGSIYLILEPASLSLVFNLKHLEGPRHVEDRRHESIFSTSLSIG